MKLNKISTYDLLREVFFRYVFLDNATVNEWASDDGAKLALEVRFTNTGKHHALVTFIFDSDGEVIDVRVGTKKVGIKHVWKFLDFEMIHIDWNDEQETA